MHPLRNLYCGLRPKSPPGRGTACHRPCRLQPLRQMHRGVPDGRHVLDRTRSERRRGSPRIIGGQNLLPDFGRRRHAVGRGAIAASRFCTRSTRRLPRAGNPYGRRVEPYGKLGCRRNVSPAGETLDVRPETGRPGTPPPLDGTEQWTDNLQSEATRRQGGADNRTHPGRPRR